MSKTTSNKVYTCDVIDDKETGDQLLQIPEEMMDELEWKVGDELKFDMKKKYISIINLSLKKRQKQPALLKGKKNG